MTARNLYLPRGFILGCRPPLSKGQIVDRAPPLADVQQWIAGHPREIGIIKCRSSYECLAPCLREHAYPIKVKALLFILSTFDIAVLPQQSAADLTANSWANRLKALT